MENLSPGFSYGSGDTGTMDFSCHGNLTSGGAVANSERQRTVSYGQEAPTLQREAIFASQETGANGTRVAAAFDMPQFQHQYQGVALQPFPNFPSSNFGQMGAHRSQMASGTFQSSSTFNNPSSFVPPMSMSQVQQQQQERPLAGLQRLPSFSSVASSVASSASLQLAKDGDSLPPNLFPGPSSQSKLQISQKVPNESHMSSAYPATTLPSHIHPGILRLVQQQELNMPDGSQDRSRDASSPAGSQSSVPQYSQHGQHDNFGASVAIGWSSNASYNSQTEDSTRKVPPDVPKHSTLKGRMLNPEYSSVVSVNNPSRSTDIHTTTALPQDYEQNSFSRATNKQSPHSPESDSGNGDIPGHNKTHATQQSMNQTLKKQGTSQCRESKFSKSKPVNDDSMPKVNFLCLGKFGDKSPWRHHIDCDVDNFELFSQAVSAGNVHYGFQSRLMFPDTQNDHTLTDVEICSPIESTHISPVAHVEYNGNLKSKILQNYEAMKISNACSIDKPEVQGVSTVSIMGKLAGRSKQSLAASASEEKLLLLPRDEPPVSASGTETGNGLQNEIQQGVDTNDRRVVFPDIPGVTSSRQRPFSVQPIVDEIPAFNYDNKETEAMRKIWQAKKEQLEMERLETHVKVEDSQCVLIGDQKRWQCQICPKNYTTKHNLVTHILDHSGIKPHLCMICGKYFKQLSHLNTHMLTHNNIKPHVCLCGKGFTQVSHLKRHQAIHQDNKPHVCDTCGKGFMYPSELRVHKEKHVPGRDKCVDCGEDFTSPKLLKQHQATHEQREELTCTECSRVFRYPSQLRDHLVIHTGTRPYICTECGLDFMKEHHLKAHMFTHTGLRPFNCLECGRTFNQKANLQRHMLIHGSERAYKCDQCDKTFTQPQTLKAHMVVHADKKPYWCDICGKEFGRLHNLQGHMHMHNNSKPYLCFCGSTFTLKGNLNRHKKVKHGLNESTESMEEEAVNFLNFMSERGREERTSDGDEDEDDNDDQEEDGDAGRDSPSLDQSEDPRSHRRERKSTPRKIPRPKDSVETGTKGAEEGEEEGSTSRYFQPLDEGAANSSKRKRSPRGSEEETRTLRKRRNVEEGAEVVIKEETGDESLSDAEKDDGVRCADGEDDDWMPDAKQPLLKRGANLDLIIATKFQNS